MGKVGNSLLMLKLLQGGKKHSIKELAEILEVALLKNNIDYDIRHTMTTDSEYEDNLGKENYFREYLYVIRGTVE
jgi:hypothetical protein